MKQPIVADLIARLSSLMGEPAEQFTPETQLLSEQGIFDSFTAIRFIMAIEEAYEVDITGEDLNFACLETVQTLSEYLLEHSPKGGNQV